MTNNLESTPVTTAKQIQARIATAQRQGRPAIVHLTQDIKSTETVVIPADHILDIDFGGYKTNLIFSVIGTLEIANGELGSPLSGTGVIMASNVAFTGASVATGNISNSSFVNCEYPTTFTDGYVTHTVISGKMSSVEAELVVGSALNTPVAIKVDLAGGLNCFDPDDSNINLTGSYTNTSNLGTQTNILARNVVSTPAVAPVDLGPLRRTEYEHKTTNYTVQYSDTGKWFTNLGATNLVTFTIPAATSDGYRFSFFVDGYTGIEIAKENPTDTIFIDGWINDDSEGKTWTSTTPGDWVTLTSWDGYTWNGIDSSGPGQNKITDVMLRDSTAWSVIGRASSSAGDPADITVSTDGYVLRLAGSTLGFGLVEQAAINGLSTTFATKVTAPASSTDNSILRFDGTTGNVAQNSSVLISDTGEISGNRVATVNYTSNQTITAAQSGTVFSNKDATGTVVLTLPNPSAGLQYGFEVDTNQTLQVVLGIPSGQYIEIDGYVAVTSYESNTPGDYLYLYAKDSNGWKGIKSGTLNGNKGDITVSDNQRQWIINDDVVTFSKMQNSAAGLAVIGRPSNTSGDFSEIVASDDGYFLGRSGTSIGFLPLPASGVSDHTLLTNIGTLTHDQLETELNNKADISDLDGYQSKYSAAGLSVLGKPNSGAGVFSEIVAADDGYVLKYTDGEIKFAEHNSGVTDHTLLTNIGTNSHATIDSHLASTSNPHNVTKSQILTGNLIVNSDIEIGADIALTKLDTVTANMALVSDADGYISAHGTVSATELGYLDGATSNIQTQLNSKVNIADLDGYVAKASSSTDNALVKFDGTSGRNIQNSGIIISDNNEMTGHRRLVSDKTANYTITSSESGTLFTNRGASSRPKFTLPTMEAGQIFSFLSYESVGIEIEPASGNAISYDGYTTNIYTGGTLILSGINDALTLVGQNDGYMFLATDFVADEYISNSNIIAGAGINLSKLESIAGLSVICNPTSSTATPIVITADTDGYVLKRSGSTLVFAPDSTGAGGVSDGTYGDIVVSGGGTNWQIGTGVITNTDISQNALIGLSKFQRLTANRALISDIDGYITVSATISDTELGYLDGVTSSIQTQLDDKANISLLDGYLGNTAIANSVIGRASNTSGLLAPIQATVSGTYLGYNGTDLVWSTPSGAGDVTGPGSATDNALTRFDGTTGKIIQNSTVTLSDTGYISGMASITGKLNTDFYITTDGTGTHKFYRNAFKRWEINNVGSLVGDDVTYSVVPRILGGSNSSSDVIYGCVADPDTGIGFGGGSTNSIKFITGGANPFEITENALVGNDGYTYTPMVIGGTNSSVAPLFTSLDDTTVGIGIETGVLNLIINSAKTFTINQYNIRGNPTASEQTGPHIRARSGSNGQPIYSFDGYSDTGLTLKENNYNDEIGLISGGSPVVWASATRGGLVGDFEGGYTHVPLIRSGSSASSSPIYSFVGQPDSGLNCDSSNNVVLIRDSQDHIQLDSDLRVKFIVPAKKQFNSHTSRTNVTVDANYSSMSLVSVSTASAGNSSYTHRIDYLKSGQSIKIYFKSNMGGADTDTITITASSTNSGHTTVASVVLDSTNLHSYVEITNFNGVFFYHEINADNSVAVGSN